MTARRDDMPGRAARENAAECYGEVNDRFYNLTGIPLERKADPMTTTTPVGIKVAHCGCRVAMARGAVNGMLWCPLHAAAGEMRNLIPRLLEHVSEAQNGETCEHSPHPIDEARALHARLGG